MSVNLIWEQIMWKNQTRFSTSIEINHKSKYDDDFNKNSLHPSQTFNISVDKYIVKITTD